MLMLNGEFGNKGYLGGTLSGKKAESDEENKNQSS
jgi:hypothetical protein